MQAIQIEQKTSGQNYIFSDFFGFIFFFRFDGRGYLSEAALADCEKEQVSLTLSPEDIHIEKECDEERYLDLHTDVSERLMFEGE